MKKTIGILLCLFVMILPLFASGRTQGSGGATELTWYVGGAGAQADTPAVLAEANKYLAEKLNVSLNIIESDWGSYTQKMQMIIASQENYDMCYTANWANNFYTNVSRDAFVALDNLINQYAPELKASLPANGWEAAKVKGKIYAVPNEQIWPYTNQVTIETSYLDRYNMNRDSVTTLAGIESLLAQIKRDNPSMYPLGANQGAPFTALITYLGLDELAGRNIPGVILLTDSSLKVVNQFELPQVLEAFRTIRQWYEKGYIRPDAETITNITPERQAGRHPVYFGGNYKPGGEIQDKINHGGRDVICVPISPSWQTTSGIVATMTAISVTSKAPEKAMQFINLVNTDKYIYNLITQGIEGKHYTKIDANYIRPIANSGYTPNADWMYGNQFLAYYKEGQNPTDWEDTKVINNTARPSPALGFSFDSTPVASELASINSVVNEYANSLGVGSVDPDRVMPEFLEKLRNAGSQRFIDEIQRQLDAWKASR